MNFGIALYNIYGTGCHRNVMGLLWEFRSNLILVLVSRYLMEYHGNYHEHIGYG
jgi:hypothetical protein